MGLWWMKCTDIFGTFHRNLDIPLLTFLVYQSTFKYMRIFQYFFLAIKQLIRGIQSMCVIDAAIFDWVKCESMCEYSNLSMNFIRFNRPFLFHPNLLVNMKRCNNYYKRTQFEYSLDANLISLSLCSRLNLRQSKLLVCFMFLTFHFVKSILTILTKHNRSTISR